MPWLRRPRPFWVNVRKNVWNCRASGAAGDAIALAQHIDGTEFLAAVETVTGEPPPRGASLLTEAEKRAIDERAAKAHAADEAKRQEQEAASFRFRERERRAAFELWTGARSLRGTLGEAYLSRRGLTAPPEARLRFHEKVAYWDRPREQGGRVIHEGPALLGAIGGPDGRFRGVQRTWIDLERPTGKAFIVNPDTGEILSSKKARGSIKGGTILLRSGGRQCRVPRRSARPLAAVSREGIETVLSVYCLPHGEKLAFARRRWVSHFGRSRQSVRQGGRSAKTSDTDACGQKWAPTSGPRAGQCPARGPRVSADHDPRRRAGAHAFGRWRQRAVLYADGAGARGKAIFRCASAIDGPIGHGRARRRFQRHVAELHIRSKRAASQERRIRLNEHDDIGPRLEGAEILAFPANASLAGDSGGDPPRAPPVDPPDDEDGSADDGDGIHGVVEKLNAEYCLVLMGSRAIIIRETPDAPIEDRTRVLSIDAFRAYFSNRSSAVKKRERREDANGTETWVNVKRFVKWAPHWLNAKNRRTYDGIEFFPDPDNAPGTKNYFNVWRGFSVKPDFDAPAAERALKYKTFRDHLLTNIANGDRKLFDWIFAWCAHIIQRPRDRAGTANRIARQNGQRQNQGRRDLRFAFSVALFSR